MNLSSTVFTEVKIVFDVMLWSDIYVKHMLWVCKKLKQHKLTPKPG